MILKIIDWCEWRIANIVAIGLAPIICDNINNGIEEFNKHCFPVPIRCKPRRFYERGYERIDIDALFPEIEDDS